MKYTDENGNEIEIEIDPKEIPKLTKEREELTKAKAELEKTKGELETKQKGLEEELGKLRSKDTNFSNLRKLSKEQQEDMLKEFNTKEQTIIQKMASIEEELNDYKNRNFQAHKNQILSQLAGSDDDLKKQIEDTAKSFAGEAKSEEELTQRLSNAYTILKGSRPTINPMNQFAPTGNNQDPYASRKKSGNFMDTPEGKEFYEKNFGHLFPKKNK